MLEGHFTCLFVQPVCSSNILSQLASLKKVADRVILHRVVKNIRQMPTGIRLSIELTGRSPIRRVDNDAKTHR